MASADDPLEDNPFKKPPKGQPKVAKPEHSPRKVKSSFVDFAPMAYSIKEGDDQRLEQLVRLGLGHPGALAFYRQAASNPREAVKSAQYRDYAGEMLANLLRIILTDDVVFSRIRTLLQTRGRTMTMEEVVAAALQTRKDSRA